MAEDAQKSNGSARPISFWGWPALVSLVVFILDQLTKLYFCNNFEVGSGVNVIPNFFNLVHYRNTGGAWGMLGNYTWILGLISLAAFVGFIIVFKKQNKGNRLVAASFAVLIGGIAGNMVDRIFRGSVVDFLDFFISDCHWPAFNVADSAICVSMVALIVLLSFQKDK